jgi:hypothetical protein
MLKIKNNSGEELMRIKDNGEEEIFDAKLKEQIEKAENKPEQKGE